MLNTPSNKEAKRMSTIVDRDNPPDNMPEKTAVHVLIYTKYMGSINSNRKPTYVESNSTLAQFKEEIARLNPQHIIKRILFGGRPLGANDDSKKLGLYKQITVLNLYFHLIMFCIYNFAFLIFGIFCKK